ncbi:MAG: phosphoadenosine phosphosulfate reductase family protein [Bacillota bacterium]|nr:phosphoadenosine phosphosulfate reductase family protein [Bacillota bacterium]
MDKERLLNWTLEQKEQESIRLIKETIDKFGLDKVATTFTGGKDSLTLLHLIKQAYEGRVPVPVIQIDTSAKFKEIYDFVTRIAKEWDLDLRVFRNDEALKTIKIAEDHVDCCYQLKTVPLQNAVRELGLAALFTAVRWDEQEARQGEQYQSPRQNPDHLRVQPILHFREIDIWRYIRKYNLPFCELYRRGYRSLGCEPCTVRGGAGGPERAGRAQDKERAMQRLREMGYF